MFTFFNEITDFWMYNVPVTNCNNSDVIHIFVVKLSSTTNQSMYHKCDIARIRHINASER